MSIIFQLFTAEDLQMLEDKDLDELKDIVLEAFLTAPVKKNLKEIQNDLEERRKKTSNTSKMKPNNTRQAPPLMLTLNIKPPPNASPQINAMLNERAAEVARQLRESRKFSPLDLSRVITQPSANQSDVLTAKEQKILNWAMSCENNFVEFYSPLRHARVVAREYFFEKTGQQPKDPDSPYSPFRRDHPLRNRSSGPYDE